MRKCHYIKPNESSQTPNNILIVDTEANILKHPDGSQHQTFRLGYAIHISRSNDKWYETGYEIRTVEDFWNLLDRIAYDNMKLYVIAHNMSYDFAILKLDSYISSRQLKLEMRVIDSVFLVRAGQILFLSSTNFYRESLERLGNIFGLPKLKSPDFENCTDDILMQYCRRDVEVLTHVMKEHFDFFRVNDLGCFRPTIAGQAFGTFRHRFMSHRLLVHDNEDILQMEKESYHGGRCEAFRIGTFDDITYLDINSMYPFVMKNELYPTELVSDKIISDVDVSVLENALDAGYFVLANCDIDLLKPAIGVKEDGKLIFPVGRIHRSVASPELQYIIEHPEIGDIVWVNDMVLYHQSPIFADYVDYFYNMRRSTDNQAYKQMCKILLNSLYGKLAQHNSSTTVLETDEINKKMYIEMMEIENTSTIHTGLGSKYVRLGSDVYLITQHDGEFARDSIPIISSAVTSYARVLLFKLFEIAGRENVLYCDTDSMFVNHEGLENLRDWISPTELGKLKIEKSGTVEIHGAKDYIFNGERTLKGVKRNAEILKDGSFKQYQFHTKHSRYNGTPDGVVVVKPVIKSISRNYNKGEVRGDRVYPFTLSEFQADSIK